MASEKSFSGHIGLRYYLFWPHPLRTHKTGANIPQSLLQNVALLGGNISFNTETVAKHFQIECAPGVVIGSNENLHAWPSVAHDLVPLLQREVLK